MKKIIFLLSFVLLFASCTTTEFGAVATGSTLGGIFGSAIGGIFGGHRGAHMGAAVGMVLGGVGGAAAASDMEARNERNDDAYDVDDDVDDRQYGGVIYRKARKTSPADGNLWANLEVQNVVFSDGNVNHALDAGEEVFLSFEIYNNGNRPLFDVSPIITCDTKHISFSPPATISVIEPGQGIRYRAMVRASSRLKNGKTIFRIIFGGNYVAKAFTVNTRH